MNTTQSWSDRALRRGANADFFRPPGPELNQQNWHTIETHLGAKRLQWRPGIDVWRGEEGERWTAEFAHENKWKYVGLSDKSGDRR